MSELTIHQNPKVRILARQTINEDGLEDFLSDEEVEKWTTDTELAGQKIAEVAGRVCYMSFAKPRPGGNKAYMEHVLSVQHGSLLEHAVWTLLITHVSRSLSHELVRHRTMSPSQLSQRYVDESRAEFVVPDVIASDREIYSLWAESINKSHETYLQLVEKLKDKFKDLPEATERRKAARQAARSVLPNACETKLVITANARALRNILELRCSRHADTEIRKLAMAIHDLLVDEAPNLFGDYARKELPDGTYEISTQSRKV